MEGSQIQLTTKPSATLHISYCPHFPGDTDNPLRDVLVVFLNGLVLPQASWNNATQHLITFHKTTNLPLPTLLSYDRFGQGTSDPDPTDPPSTPYGHDALTVVADLHQLLTQLSHDRLNRDLDSLRLILVGNSIGCPLARLYAAAHPGFVVAFLFLDSMMANTDFVSLLPDPESSSFDEGTLPPDVTADDVRHARTQIRSFFHPTLPNREGFDRRYLARQLPLADQPALPAGPGGREPMLIVVGHDPETFAEQSEAVSTIPFSSPLSPDEPGRRISRDDSFKLRTQQ